MEAAALRVAASLLGLQADDLLEHEECPAAKAVAAARRAGLAKGNAGGRWCKTSLPSAAAELRQPPYLR